MESLISLIETQELVAVSIAFLMGLILGGFSITGILFATLFVTKEDKKDE